MSVFVPKIPNQYHIWRIRYPPDTMWKENYQKELISVIENNLLLLKGEVSSQLYPTFFWLDIKSLIIRSQQKKPHQKIFRFG